MQAAFIFCCCCYFLFVQFSYFFLFFGSLFVFLISHHHFMWAVKIQRSDRQLPWDSWASSHCSLHYHPYNSYHPDHCRLALAFMKAPPPNSPRNVPGFLLLVFYLNYTLLMPSSSDSYHIWFHGCGVFFFCSSSNFSFLSSLKSVFSIRKAFVVKDTNVQNALCVVKEIAMQNLI